MDENTTLAIVAIVTACSITIMACFGMWMDYKSNQEDNE